jgi:hypothetical protein
MKCFSEIDVESQFFDRDGKSGGEGRCVLCPRTAAKVASTVFCHMKSWLSIPFLWLMNFSSDNYDCRDWFRVEMLEYRSMSFELLATCYLVWHRDLHTYWQLRSREILRLLELLQICRRWMLRRYTSSQHMRVNEAPCRGDPSHPDLFSSGTSYRPYKLAW